MIYQLTSASEDIEQLFLFCKKHEPHSATVLTYSTFARHYQKWIQESKARIYILEEHNQLKITKKKDL